MQKNLFSEMVLNKKVEQFDDYVALEELIKHMSEVEGQDIDEPFIQDLIKNLFLDYREDQRYERMYQMIQNINFKYISQNDKYMIIFLLYKELKKPLNRYMKRNVRNLDPQMLVYLLKNLLTQFDLNDNNTNQQKL